LASLSGRGDLTDKHWERLRRWIPAPAPTGRPITRSRRVLVNGVAWRVRAGAPWRDVPEHYGPWPTVYRLIATAGIAPFKLSHRYHQIARAHFRSKPERPGAWEIYPTGSTAGSR
jgi:transposase